MTRNVQTIYSISRIRGTASFTLRVHTTVHTVITNYYVPEVLNVHMNKSKKKICFFRRIFFSSSEKLTFEEENVIFFNTYLNFNLFNLIVVNFL